MKGVFQQIFEEEYTNLLNENLSLFDDAYQAYLRRFPRAGNPQRLFFHRQEERVMAIDSKPGRKSDLSDDISAYDLILKNKERLLSFDEPTTIYLFTFSFGVRAGIIQRVPNMHVAATAIRK